MSTEMIRDENVNLLRGGGQRSAEIQTIKRGGARVLSKKRLGRNTKTTLKRILLTDSNVFRGQRCKLLTFPTVQGIANKTKVSDRSLNQRVPVGKVLCPPFFRRKTTCPEGIRRTFVPGLVVNHINPLSNDGGDACIMRKRRSPGYNGMTRGNNT